MAFFDTQTVRRLVLTLLGSATVVTGALGLVRPWEHEVRVGYVDPVGVPTYCYGATGPSAVVGRQYTHAECEARLMADVRRHSEPLANCLTNTHAPPHLVSALEDLSFNIGPSGVCRSQVIRDTNAGRFREACNALPNYNTAVDRRTHRRRVIRGLTNRRNAERAYCLRELL